jgi:PhnB protein
MKPAETPLSHLSRRCIRRKRPSPCRDGDDDVAQLADGDAAFWVARTLATQGRLSPRAIGGTTSRTLLVIQDPANIVKQAVAAGATETSCVNDEHGWRLGRIIDPFGHEWEIGVPLGPWRATDIPLAPEAGLVDGLLAGWLAAGGLRR